MGHRLETLVRELAERIGHLDDSGTRDLMKAGIQALFEALWMKKLPRRLLKKS